MDYHARRVLVCLRYGIGDVVMELPVLAALRDALPQARITALGASPAVQLVERFAGVDEVATLNEWGFRHRWDRGPAGAARAVGAWLDEHDFDLFLDVHHVTPAFSEVVWNRGVRSLEADEAVETAALRRGHSGVGAVRAAVEAGWGLHVQGAPLPRIQPTAEMRSFASDFLDGHGIGCATPLAISPVASLALKRWPLRRLARVADRMVEATGDPILVFCGPQLQAGEALRGMMRHGTRAICVGPLHLLRVAAVLERCGAFICNDTGLMHIAGALGVPTVAIFGPTAPSIYRPPSPAVVSAGGEDVECPHRRTTSLHPPACFAEGHCLLGHAGCIDGTREEDVLQAVEAVLRTPEGSRPALSIA